MRIFFHIPSGVRILAPLLDVGTAVRGLGSADAELFMSFQDCVLTLNGIEVEDFKLRSKLSIFSLS